MEITGFSVYGEKVTLQMSDMPIGSRTENTVVYIKGTPLGQPEEVHVTNQQIVFSAANAAAKGKISVRITLENGDQLSATSSEDYKKPAEEGGWADGWIVKSVTPPSAAPGAAVTLKGKNLKGVRMVSLMTTIDGKQYSYSIPRVTHPDDNSVRFVLPGDITHGRYPIVLQGASGRSNSGKFIAVSG